MPVGSVGSGGLCRLSESVLELDGVDHTEGPNGIPGFTHTSLRVTAVLPACS
jgi:hypothetical protein